HPVHRHLGLEGLQQVPGDGFALAVLIGGEVELVRLLQQRLELGDLLLLVGADDVERLEAVVDVDAVLGPGLALVLGRDVGGRPARSARPRRWGPGPWRSRAPTPALPGGDGRRRRRAATPRRGPGPRSSAVPLPAAGCGSRPPSRRPARTPRGAARPPGAS